MEKFGARMVHVHRVLKGRVLLAAVAGALTVLSPQTIGASAPPAAAPAVRADAAKPVAVVELFTSEACPNCPAADAQLRELAAEARRTGHAVFPLAFHVDYWNPPGRRDPLSRDEFSSRQKAYVRAMGLDSAYTPQMIVNGTEEFVGSDAAKVRRSLAAALSRPARTAINLRAGLRAAPDAGHAASIRVDLAVSPVPPHAVLNLAVVERGLTFRLAGGQRECRYDHVVRAFRSLPLPARGQQTLDLPVPDALKPANACVVAYVQDARTKVVLGASSLELAPAP